MFPPWRTPDRLSFQIHAPGNARNLTPRSWSEGEFSPGTTKARNCAKCRLTGPVITQNSAFLQSSTLFCCVCKNTTHTWWPISDYWYIQTHLSPVESWFVHCSCNRSINMASLIVNMYQFVYECIYHVSHSSPWYFVYNN